jgi:ubiquinone/menaquinone biosynthesis C-methylase UbiE
MRATATGMWMKRVPRAQQGRGHRFFAAAWDFQVRHEPEAESDARRRTAAGLRGRVLEVGAGTGANWRFLPDGVDYSGIEPDPAMLRRARRAAATSGHAYDLVQARAEAIPFPDASFDAVLVTLTLCSIADVPAALSEVRRVLKPGGAVHFWEHVRPSGRLSGRLADAITPAWKRIGAGCHPNRRSLDALRAAGFVVSEQRAMRLRGVPFVEGVARVP